MADRGRPPMELTEEISDAILNGLAEGDSLITILKGNDRLPSYATVMKWLKVFPDFAENYARAREYQADHDADKIGEIAQRVMDGEVEPNAARVAIDAYKWAAGKRKPKVYGDKVAIGGAEDLPPMKTTQQLDVSTLTLEQLEALGAALQNSIK